MFLAPQALRSFFTRTLYAVVAACIFSLLAVTQAVAQGPTGISGGVQGLDPADPNVFSTNVRFARISGTAASGRQVSFSVPVNGISNYVSYYEVSNLSIEPVRDQFLPRGNYTLQLLDGNRSPISTEGSTSYEPEGSLYRQVRILRPLNSSPEGVSGALGIQGIVRDSFGNAVFGARVNLFSNGQFISSVETNGNGFYSFYYSAGTDKDFIQPGGYTVQASNGVSTDETFIQYSPSTALDRTYFVVGAQAVVRDLTISRPSETTPVYRLLASNGDHFYTESAQERNEAVATLNAVR